MLSSAIDIWAEVVGLGFYWGNEVLRFLTQFLPPIS